MAGEHRAESRSRTEARDGQAGSRDGSASRSTCSVRGGRIMRSRASRRRSAKRGASMRNGLRSTAATGSVGYGGFFITREPSPV